MFCLQGMTDRFEAVMVPSPFRVKVTWNTAVSGSFGLALAPKVKLEVE